MGSSARVIDDDDIEPANSLLSVNWELAYVVGPPVAGFPVGTTGVGTALIIDAASFAAMSWLSFRLPDLRVPAREERGRPAFAVLARYPTAVVLTACAAGFLFLSGATDLLYPVYALKVLQDGAFAFGVLLGAAGAGGLCGVLCGLPLLLRLPMRARLPVVIAAGAGVLFSGAVSVGVIVLAVAYLVLAMLPLIRVGVGTATGSAGIPSRPR